LGSCTSLHGKAFLTLKSQPKLYYPNKIRTCEQGTTVNKYKEKAKLSHQNYTKDARVKIFLKIIKKNKNTLE
jgi:hypothetical protein